MKKNPIVIAMLAMAFIVIIFEDQISGLFSQFMEPILAHYSRKIPVEKASETGLRFFALYLIIGAFLVHFYPIYKKWINGFLDDYSHPANLAILRIIIFIRALTYLDYGHIQTLVSMSDAIVPPTGMGFILKLIPPSHGLIMFLAIAFLITTTFAIIGFKTRFAMISSTVIAIYLIGFPNFFGKVNHYNHQIWFMFVISMSMAGDYWSFDKYLSKAKEVHKKRAYSVPILTLWFVVGLMYFFPGAWKLCYSGFDWFMSDNLKYTLFEKYLESGKPPMISITEWPYVYRTLGFYTIAFEICLIFLIFIPRVRWLALFSALSFHIGVYFMMNINFLSLMFYYTAFVNWEKILKLQASTLVDKKFVYPKPLGAFVALLLVFGAFGIVHGWPISCYPAFATIKTRLNKKVIIKHRTLYEERVLDLDLSKKVIGSDILWTLLDQRNKNYQANFLKFSSMARKIYGLHEGELVFYNVDVDLEHYPVVREVRRHEIFVSKL